MSDSVQSKSSVFDEFFESCKLGNYKKCEKMIPQIDEEARRNDDDSRHDSKLLKCLSDSLVEVCKSNFVEILKLLLTHPKINVNGPNRWGKKISPLYCAAENNHLEVIKLLLSHEKIDPHKGIFKPGGGWYGKDTDYSPLYIAAKKNHLKAVELITAHPKCDMDRGYRMHSDKGPGTFNHRSPFFVACEKGNIDIIHFLFSQEKTKKCKININAGYPSLFNIACRRKSYKIVKILLQREDIKTNQECFEGHGDFEPMIPFQRAAMDGNLAIFVMLICSEGVNKVFKKDQPVHKDIENIHQKFKKDEGNFRQRYKEFDGFWKPEYFMLFSSQFKNTVITLLCCANTEKCPLSEDIFKYVIIPFLDPYYRVIEEEGKEKEEEEEVKMIEKKTEDD